MEGTVGSLHGVKRRSVHVSGERELTTEVKVSGGYI